MAHVRRLFKLEVHMENAAFDQAAGGDPGEELGRILTEAADKVRNGAAHSPLVDSNGNRVGYYCIRKVVYR